MAKKTRGTTRLKKAEARVQERVDQIDDDITELETLLGPYEKIKAEIDKLRSARRALLGGSRMTGEGGSKIRQQDIVEWLTEHPGSTPGDIAKALGTRGPTVSAHLSRRKGERFLTKNGKWWNRDPKAGINTPDDIPEEEPNNG